MITSTDRDFSFQYQNTNISSSKPINSNEPNRYPNPSVRSIKSDMALPAIALDVNVSQYRPGVYRACFNLHITATAKIERKSHIVKSYPIFSVIEKRSAPVSPSVVAAILMIQYNAII